MATANGTLTPPSLNSSTSSTSITKRKRSHSSTELQANGATSEPTSEPAKSPDEDLQHLLEDILAVLRRFVMSSPISPTIILSQPVTNLNIDTGTNTNCSVAMIPNLPSLTFLLTLQQTDLLLENHRLSALNFPNAKNQRLSLAEYKTDHTLP